VNEKYSGVDYYQQKATVAEYKKKQADLHLALIEHDQFLFKQQVVKYIPQMMHEDSYAARNIASVLSNQQTKLEKDESLQDLDEAKAYFLEGNYLSAIPLLVELAKHADALIYGPEITYLLMESYHQTQDYIKASEQIEIMLRLYPESHLAGYALIRLGDYYAMENKKEDAQYTYEFTIENFSFDAQIVLDAKKRLGAL